MRWYHLEVKSSCKKDLYPYERDPKEFIESFHQMNQEEGFLPKTQSARTLILVLPSSIIAINKFLLIMLPSLLSLPLEAKKNPIKIFENIVLVNLEAFSVKGIDALSKKERFDQSGIFKKDSLFK